MKYLKEGMKIRRKRDAVSRFWWTRGKEYEVFETGNELVEEFYILDDDGDDVYFDFDCENESFLTNVEVIGNFEVVGELYEEPKESPSGSPLKNTRKAIHQIENDLAEVGSRIGYSYHENRETLERDYLKRDLLNTQLNCMNAIIKDLEEYFKHE